jgi:hypothetical protein
VSAQDSTLLLVQRHSAHYVKARHSAHYVKARHSAHYVKARHSAHYVKARHSAPAGLYELRPHPLGLATVALAELSCRPEGSGESGRPHSQARVDIQSSAKPQQPLLRR